MLSPRDFRFGRKIILELRLIKTLITYKNTYMKSKFTKIIIVFAFIATVVILSYLFMTKNCENSSVEASPQNAPEYILSMWPYPESRIKFLCYIDAFRFTKKRGGIGVTIETVDIIYRELSEFPDEIIQPFEERIELSIDGVNVSKASLNVVESGGEIGVIVDGTEYLSGAGSAYTFSWSPIIFQGYHIAKIKIHSPLAEPLEYQWGFTLK